MIRKFSGIDYFFTVEISPHEREFLFVIVAIHQGSKRFSRINTLNTVLAEFGIGEDDPRSGNSCWLVSRKEFGQFERVAQDMLTDKDMLAYLERKLDEDRECGEWENELELVMN